MEYVMTAEQIKDFEIYLRREERADNTIEKYLHSLRSFFVWVDSRNVTKETVTEWKETLKKSGFAAVTVNASLAALHIFFAFVGWEECRVKYLKIQRRIFRNPDRELSRNDYMKLICCANGKRNTRLVLLMETISATGIRVSEVQYIIVESAKRGVAEISLKGKIRTILIPKKLARKLLKYAGKQKIASGEIFVTKSGKGMSRRQIWGEMKRLCKDAGVDESKVFPHNLRHLFARAFYKISRDIVRLADVLGHSSIETTRIYLVTTETEHRKYLDQLGMVS